MPSLCHPERGLFFAPQARRTIAVEGPLLSVPDSSVARRSPRTLKAPPL